MGRSDGAIERLRQAWHDLIAPSALRAVVAVALGLALGAVCLARLGSLPARLAAAALLFAALGLVVARLGWQRRRSRDAEHVLRTSLGAVDPALGAAALRARRLADTTLLEPRRGSAELAALHLDRLLGRAPVARIAARANRRAWRWSAVALGVATGCVVLVASDPLRLLEGLDVLAARGDVAPVPLAWLERAEVELAPPAYLHQARRSVDAYGAVAVPDGTELTLRGVPRRPDRALVLTDGSREVRFEDDGSGAVVAHFTIAGDVELRVAATFGAVRIFEPGRTVVHALPDMAPTVRLEGAPRTARLLDEPRISVHYEASDDHGLGAVDLVLRAGSREERRPLSKPQGGSRVDRGGIDLLSSDPFFKRTYLPVELTVEARDDDPVRGPTWGRSAAIMIVPAKIGEREALRYAAVRAGRDALTDMLAGSMALGPPDGPGLPGHLARETALLATAGDALSAMLDKTFGGLTVPSALAALTRGHLERLSRALGAERDEHVPIGHDKLLDVSERAVLALDSALGALGVSDTQASARKLADVATDAANAIAASEEPTRRERGEQRLLAALTVLSDGGEQLLRLGWLGLDLGEIVQNGLRRIRRAWEPRDRYHAKLAAEDLAARLRQPFPSFGSSGGRGGTESGGMGVPQPGEGQGSEAAAEAAKIAEMLEQLRQEHAEQMEEVARALEQAMTPELRQAMKEKLKERAEAVRRAVEQMPDTSGSPVSAPSEAARQKGGEGRAHAEAMAEALERGDLSEAIRRGDEAVRALGAAEKAAREDAAGSDRELGARAGASQSEVERHVEDTKRDLSEAQRRASEAAKDELGHAAKRERALADKARELRDKSAGGEAALPEALLRKLEEAGATMDQAAEELEQGRGAEGTERQREAQRMLESMMPDDRDGGEHPKDGAEDADDGPVGGHVPVPGKGKSEDADAFRKRVLDGLSGPVSPGLRDALRRYAEGLLR
ncbi:MAG: DUF4175 family protein [Polyangiaceae bacterium]|nr:DUF4175 family protein [Polyangiaceae bacterium]